ncbi:MAG: peptidoglycan bridge formation glycyltransferase FemA/FemB family protein [Candidatus Gracilibacteria bacterium]|nr:peptidoglycan bridge formation glycyltransferase FemA/FemB family protein [Candidatus Gracilibacteria bacterium]
MCSKINALGVQLKIITDKKEWNCFIEQNQFEFYSFLCSWEWTLMQELSGKKVLKYGIYKNHPQPLLGKEGGNDELGEELIGILPLIVNKAKRGTYLFCPHTPLIKKSEDFFKVLENIKIKLIKIGKEKNANFIRFNSPIKNLIQNKNSFKKLGFINAPMHEHAEDTHLLNLNLSEEELLQNIKKKDRYYINRAIKEGVEVVKGNTPEQIKILGDMHLEHSKKIGYHPFSENFINNLYKTFGKNITTISTRFEGKIESILMTIKFHKTCVYYIATGVI